MLRNPATSDDGLRPPGTYFRMLASASRGRVHSEEVASLQPSFVLLRGGLILEPLPDQLRAADRWLCPLSCQPSAMRQTRPREQLRYAWGCLPHISYDGEQRPSTAQSRSPPPYRYNCYGPATFEHDGICRSSTSLDPMEQGTALGTESSYRWTHGS